MQQENSLWKERLNSIEGEFKDMKESVEMAHNLIRDKTQNRTSEVNSLKMELAEQATEMANNSIVEDPVG